MFKWLQKALTVRETTSADVMGTLMQLKRQHETIVDELELTKARLRKTEGRVYALWGKKRPDLFEGTEEAAAPTSLSDPRLTKDQLRARLLPHGKRFKHTN